MYEKIAKHISNLAGASMVASSPSSQETATSKLESESSESSYATTDTIEVVSPPVSQQEVIALEPTSKLSESKYCLKCGENIPLDSSFCPKCGGVIEAVPPTDPVPKQAEPPTAIPVSEVMSSPVSASIQTDTPTVIPLKPDGPLCSKCGYRNLAGGQICTNCGFLLETMSAVDAEGIMCKKCGSRNLANAKLCKKCGNKIAAILSTSPLKQSELSSSTPVSKQPEMPTAIPPQEEGLLCANCGYQNKADAQFCAKCGEKVETSRSRFCPKCGDPVAEDEKFCDKCGAKIEAVPSSKFCPKCGDPIAEGEIFCDKCGKKLV
jgi:predicted amidophosphoribosyltransferase